MQKLRVKCLNSSTKRGKFQLQSDLSLLKCLHSCRNLLEQGYEDRVRRMLSKYNVAIDMAKEEVAAKELAELESKTRAKVEKARSVLAAKPEDLIKVDEPEVKKRREERRDGDGSQEKETTSKEI